MKIIVVAIAALALASCSAQPASNADGKAAAAERPSDAESEAYMRKAEADWADLSVRKIPGLMERILADDYQGVSSEGDTRDKARQVALQEEGPSGKFVSSKLDYVKYRHFGDTVIAQGGESLQHRDGSPDLRIAWHDIWMFRDGKWQIVASHDSELPAKK